MKLSKSFPGKTPDPGGFVGKFAQNFNKHIGPNHRNISIEKKAFKLYL